jgi:ubiquinone/menaquinone biosynthesis C-methylase UbiE
MTALEYGCGTGLLSFALQPYLAHITLADSSAGMLAVLKEKIASSGVQNMTPLRLDLATDPLPQAQYDLIYTLMVLHHVLDTDSLLRDFYELLGTPGYLCIADLDKEDGSFHGPDFPGHKGFDRKELSEKAEQAGFRANRFTTIFQTPREVDGQRREFPLFLMLAEKR